MKSMRRRIFLILFGYLSIIIIFPLFSYSIFNGLSSHQSFSKTLILSQGQEINHEPILVDGNQGFDPVIWGGSGSEIDPYFINGLKIKSLIVDGYPVEFLIEIRNTDSFFEITNSILESGINGIHLENVTNGKIINNTIYKNDDTGIFLFESKNITINDNFIFNNSQNGIFLSDSNNITLCNNSIFSNPWCIRLSDSEMNLIANNSVSNSGEDGIDLTRSPNNNIINNSIYDNIENGIELDRSPNNTINNNIFQNNGLYVSASNIEDCFQTSVAGNIIDGKPLFFLQNTSQLTVPQDINQVILVNCSSIEIAQRGINIGFIGIQIAFSSNITILNNTIPQTKNGINLYSSTNVTIHNNTINLSHSGGIYLDSSTNNSIFDNTIFNCSDNGIGIADNSHNNSLYNNNISNNTLNGIYLYGSEKNTIINNSVDNNGNDGIYFSRSPNNYIVNNTIFNNFEYGIDIFKSSNNSLINNSLKNNGLKIYSPQIQECFQSTISNNLIDNKLMIYWQNIDTATVPTNIGQVTLINCTNIEIRDLKIRMGGYGLSAVFCSKLKISNNSIHISMYNTENNTIYNNSIYENTDHGIFLGETKNNIITNNTICNTGNGITLSNSINSTIFNNSIFSNSSYMSGAGIFLDDSVNNSIIDNNIFNLTEAIFLDDSSNNKIENNNIYDSETAIYLFLSGNNTILNNKMDNCGIRFYGVGVIDFLQFNVDGNYINNKPLIFWENINNAAVPSDVGQIVLINCTNIDIQGHELDFCTTGVILACCLNTTIYNNTFDRILFGIEILVSKNNIITNNTIYNSLNDGIRLVASHNNTITTNIICFTNEYGINLYDTKNNTISFNIILLNVDYCIKLSYQSQNNTIQYNDFVTNHTFDGISQVIDDGINNTFSYNFWSDWRSPDQNLDGVVDIPYPLMGLSNNTDPYPLTDPNQYVYPVNHPLIDPNQYINPDDILLLEDFIDIALLLSICALFVFGSFLFFSKYNKKRLTTAVSPQLLDKTNRSSSDDLTDSSDGTTTLVPMRTDIELGDSPDLVLEDKITIKIWIIGLLSSIIWFIASITLYPLKKRKLTREEVVNNPIRNQILVILHQTEFEYYRSLRYKLKCGNSILKWHLQVLIDFKLVIERTISQFKLYHIANRSIDENKLLLYTKIRSKKALTIIQTILLMKERQWTIDEIVQKSNLHYKIIEYYSKKLIKLGILKYDSTFKLYFLVEGQTKYLSWIIEKYNLERYI